MLTQAFFLFERDFLHLRARVDAVLWRAGGNVGRYLFRSHSEMCLGRCCSGIVRHDPAVNRYHNHLWLAGILLALTACLFHAASDAQTQTLAWTVIFLSLRLRPAQRIDSKRDFPAGNSTLASQFSTYRTFAGGVGAPALFGWIIGTGSSTALFAGYLVCARC